jgi:hypothetical protein
MTIRDSRYPKDWPKISRRVIESAKNRCQECGLIDGVLVRRKWVGRKQITQLVTKKEFLLIRQAAIKKTNRTRYRLTKQQRDEFMFRLAFAELVKDDPSWTVMIDPDERWGYYQEGEYYPYPDDDDYDSAYTREIRELKSLGLTRIILQTHHIDENPSNCDDKNLIALCQFCHGGKHGLSSKSI